MTEIHYSTETKIIHKNSLTEKHTHRHSMIEIKDRDRDSSLGLCVSTVYCLPLRNSSETVFSYSQLRPTPALGR